VYEAWNVSFLFTTSVRKIFRSFKYLASYVHNMREETRGSDVKSVQTKTEREKRVILGRPRRRWEHKTEPDLKKLYWGGGGGGGDKRKIL
jgi:hypothetical protein